MDEAKCVCGSRRITATKHGGARVECVCANCGRTWSIVTVPQSCGPRISANMVQPTAEELRRWDKRAEKRKRQN
jgi:hypothetical protein